jgi:glucokinase-like ROK family protein
MCRWVNSGAVLQLVRDRGPLFCAAIARSLDLNPASVTRIVNELLAKGLVREIPVEPPKKRGVGRPPVWIEFNSQVSLAAGVDIGGTSTDAALLDLAGNMLRRASVRSEPGERGFAILVKLLEDLLLSSAPTEPRPGVIVLGVPGVVDPQDGRVVSAPTLDWRDFPLKGRLEEHFRVPVLVENDVNLHALGEHWRGAGQGILNLVCVFVGTGIGAGIIVGGELYHGTHWSAGEIGHFLPNVRYLGQEFAGFGCLEQLASGYGIAQRGRDAVLAGNGKGILAQAGSPEDIEAIHVLAACREGDRTARQIVDEAQRQLAMALANLACVLNPEVIVLGGGIVKSDVLDLDLLREWVFKAVPVAPRIVVSTLGSDAGLLGAVALALQSEEFLETLLDRSGEGKTYANNRHQGGRR